MKKLLKVTKPDGTIHYVALALKSHFLAHNNLVKPADQYLLEEVDESTIDRTKWKDENFASVSVQNTKELTDKISERDAEIEKHKLEKEELQKKLDAILANALPANDVIAKIKSATTVDEVNEIVGNDIRVSVVKASNAKIAELEAK